MEMIPEETAGAPATEGLGEPTPAQGVLRPPEQPDPMGSAGTPQERTLPGATGQPQPGSEPPGDAEQPGPGAAGQPSSTEAEPPPSPYLTPDFGKEDPFEILGKAAPPPSPPCSGLCPQPGGGGTPGPPFLGSATSPPLPSWAASFCSWLVAHRQPSSSGFTVNRAKCGVSPPQASPSPAWHAWRCPGLPGGTRSPSCPGTDSRRLAAAEGQRVPCPAPPSLGGAKPSSGGGWGGPLRGQLLTKWGAWVRGVLRSGVCPGGVSRSRRGWHGGGSNGVVATEGGTQQRGLERASVTCVLVAHGWPPGTRQGDRHTAGQCWGCRAAAGGP